jgi:hypothetical protein
MAMRIIRRGGAGRRGADPAKIQRATGSPDRRQLELATIGFTSDQAEWPEDTPAWIRWEQGEPLAEVTLRDGDKITARIGVPSTEPLTFGQQVIIALPDGDPQLAVIVATLCDSRFPEPSTVCGVSTGAGDAVKRGDMIPAATWQFMRLATGRMLGIQTQGADVLIWSGGSVHIRCSTANAAGAPDGVIHLDGRVALGARPLAPPIGSEVAPGGAEVPGVLAVPAVSVPYSPPAPVAPLAISYQGNEDGIVRAKDMYMSTEALDLAFWTWVKAVSAGLPVPLLPPAIPTVLYSAISGVAGPGSMHTATGDSEP